MQNIFFIWCCCLMENSLFSMTKSWCSGFSTSVSDYSKTRHCQLLSHTYFSVRPSHPSLHYPFFKGVLHILPCPPTPPIAPPHGINHPSRRTLFPDQNTDPLSSWDIPLTWSSPVSKAPAHLLPSLAVVSSLVIPPPTIPAVFPSPLLQYICRNIF